MNTQTVLDGFKKVLEFQESKLKELYLVYSDQASRGMKNTAIDTAERITKMEHAIIGTKKSIELYQN